MRLSGIAFLGALAAFPAAGAPTLSLPVDCDLGNTCFIQNYVDQDPSEAFQDHACGALSYDGHKGTDFALPTLTAMSEGVDVLAAAAGVVTGIRDGMEDRLITPETITALNGRDCGNGVVIDHGEGWVTQYCHLKRGSVTVATGDTVERGQPLGEIGLSGRTEFPHLHLSVRHDEQVVDPFSLHANDTCGGDHRSLWADDIAYVAGGIIRAGFEVDVPAYEMVKSGAAGRRQIPSLSKALVLFAHAFGSQPGDELTLQIDGPEGVVFQHSQTLERQQAQYFRAGGRRTPREGWPKGAYLGHITLKRDGVILDQTTVPVSFE